MNIDEMKDRIARAEEIQRYTENRCEVLEKENAELKLKLEALEGQTPWKDIKDKGELIGKLTNAKELLRKLVLEVKGYEEINGYDTCEPVQEAEQFLKENR